MEKTSWLFHQHIQFNQLSCWWVEVNGKPREALKQNTLCNQQRGMLQTWTRRLGGHKRFDIVTRGSTCMLLHASRAQNKTQISHHSIAFEDTDILFLCQAFNKEMTSPLYVKCAVLNWTRYLDITKLVSYWRWCLSGPCWTACILHRVWLCECI